MCIYTFGMFKKSIYSMGDFFSRVLFSCSMRCMRGVLAERKRDCL